MAAAWLAFPALVGMVRPWLPSPASWASDLPSHFFQQEIPEIDVNPAATEVLKALQEEEVRPASSVIPLDAEAHLDADFIQLVEQKYMEKQRLYQEIRALKERLQESEERAKAFEVRALRMTAMEKRLSEFKSLSLLALLSFGIQRNWRAMAPMRAVWMTELESITCRVGKEVHQTCHTAYGFASFASALYLHEMRIFLALRLSRLTPSYALEGLALHYSHIRDVCTAQIIPASSIGASVALERLAALYVNLDTWCESRLIEARLARFQFLASATGTPREMASFIVSLIGNRLIAVGMRMRKYAVSSSVETRSWSCSRWRQMVATCLGRYRDAYRRVVHLYLPVAHPNDIATSPSWRWAEAKTSALGKLVPNPVVHVMAQPLVPNNTAVAKPEVPARWARDPKRWQRRPTFE